MSVYKIKIEFSHISYEQAESEEEAIGLAKANIEASGYFVARKSIYTVEAESPKEIICEQHLVVTRDCGCGVGA